MAEATSDSIWNKITKNITKSASKTAGDDASKYPTQIDALTQTMWIRKKRYLSPENRIANYWGLVIIIINLYRKNWVSKNHKFDGQEK